MTTITTTNTSTPINDALEIYNGFIPSGTEKPKDIWVGADGKVFIFRNVILDETQDFNFAFEMWYENNRIMERYTYTSSNDISYGELDEPKCEIINHTWATEGLCSENENDDDDEDPFKNGEINSDDEDPF